MRQVTLFLLTLIFCACYNIYGLALNEGITNSIPANPHVDYPLAKTETAIPKSIIFIIADGTGIGQYSLSYYANGEFAPARFDHVGLVATHPNDGNCATTCNRVTDSAASGTALSAGMKTYNGAIAVDNEQNPVKTMLEWAEEKGMSTGLVATSSVTHATPASFAAHVDYRKMEAEIAQQMAVTEIEVILGGGREFWPDNLIKAWESRGGQFISEITAPTDKNKRLLGLFADGALPKNNDGRSPSTTAMASTALDRLDADPDGFFVMIEESQVDWGGHANSAEYIQGEMASLNELINFTLDYQEANPDVLVILTADHECGGVAVHDGEDGGLDIRFTSGYHSANFVPIFATGPGAEVFDGFFDNTAIGNQLIHYIRNR